MKLSEQVRRIVKAAPHLPRHSITVIAILIATFILLSEGIRKSIGSWAQVEAIPYHFSDIQERIRDKKPDFFFNTSFYYVFDSDTFNLSRETAFPDLSITEVALKKEKSNVENINLWINKSTGEILFTENETNPTSYFILAIMMGFVLLGFRWFFLKYYEGELED